MSILLAKSIFVAALSASSFPIERCIEPEESQKIEEVITACEYHAQLGSAQAQAILGVLYFSGNGLEKDLQKSAALLQKAAEQKHVHASALLGVLYEKGQGVSVNEERAFELYTVAAEGGFGEAQYNLASLYSRGAGTEKNLKEAAKWYEESARSGYTPAKFNLGLAYLFGKGIPKDETKAYDLFKSAAEDGMVAAQRNVGLIHSNKGEYVEAKHWLSMAAKQGDKEAIDALELISTYEKVHKELPEKIKKKEYFDADNLGQAYGMMMANIDNAPFYLNACSKEFPDIEKDIQKDYQSWAQDEHHVIKKTKDHYEEFKNTNNEDWHRFIKTTEEIRNQIFSNFNTIPAEQKRVYCINYFRSFADGNDRKKTPNKYEFIEGDK